jgi:hypothetical protein
MCSYRTVSRPRCVTSQHNLAEVKQVCSKLPVRIQITLISAKLQVLCLTRCYTRLLCDSRLEAWHEVRAIPLANIPLWVPAWGPRKDELSHGKTSPPKPGPGWVCDAGPWMTIVAQDQWEPSMYVWIYIQFKVAHDLFQCDSHVGVDRDCDSHGTG